MSILLGMFLAHRRRGIVGATRIVVVLLVVVVHGIEGVLGQAVLLLSVHGRGAVLAAGKDDLLVQLQFNAARSKIFTKTQDVALGKDLDGDQRGRGCLILRVQRILFFNELVEPGDGLVVRGVVQCHHAFEDVLKHGTASAGNILHGCLGYNEVVAFIVPLVADRFWSKSVRAQGKTGAPLLVAPPVGLVRL